MCNANAVRHDDVIKWNHFPRYWPFKRGIHRSPVNSPHKGQWRGALMFPLICARINVWVNEAGDSRRHRAHYDAVIMRRSHSHECATRMQDERNNFDFRVHSYSFGKSRSMWFALIRRLFQVVPLHWRHSGRDGVSNHQPHDCLLNRIFRRRWKKTSKLCVTGRCAGNSPGTGDVHKWTRINRN